MVFGNKSVSVNYPNIPVVSGDPKNVTYGQFFPSPYDARNDFESDIAEVSSKDLYLPNFALRSIEGNFYRDAVLYNEDSLGVDLLGSCLFLRGNVMSKLPSLTNPLEGYHGTQNFKYDPNNEFVHIVPGNNPFHILHFSYTEDYLSQFLPDDESWADDLKKRIRNRERIHGDRAVHISAPQERALQTIFDNPLTGKLGYLMMETAVVQIILLQLNNLFKNAPAPTTQGLTKRDLEIVHGLKEHLTNNFLEDHSLVSLAQQFGVNTNKLMNSFKKLFGQSIFEFIQELRMKYAHQLLLERDMLVTEVSRAVGYKNPNHFSVAFKRQFGICPREVR